ncbi:MAG: hypothetical protein KAI06_05395, partial [Anaerolineales bacterium]|nr:hypothetical protein [Anaerolineales bacterium]
NASGGWAAVREGVKTFICREWGSGFGSSTPTENSSTVCDLVVSSPESHPALIVLNFHSLNCTHDLHPQQTMILITKVQAVENIFYRGMKTNRTDASARRHR